MKRGYKYALSIIPGIFCGTMLMFLLIAFLTARQMEILKQHGVPAEGYVTGLQAVSNRDGSVNYIVDYRFLPGGAEGRRQHYYVWKSGVSRSEFAGLQIGETVGVIYASGRPDNSALAMTVDAKSNHPYRRLLHIAALFVLGFGGFSLAGVAYMYGAYRRERRLALWGRAAEAVIVSERRVRFGQGRSTEVTYQFRDETGSIVTAKRLGASIQKSPWNSRFPVGTSQKLTVLHDPAKSSRSMLYPSAILEVYAAKEPVPA